MDPTRERRSPDAPAAEGAEVLVIEDDVGSRKALENVLRDRGYRVTAVGDVNEAMRRLREPPPPALIVLDLMMPGKDGWDFRQEQKKDPKLAAIPVIAVSAVGKLLDVEVSLRKPVDYDEFLRAVARYLEGRAG